jgi:hypothetical protein
MASAKTAVIEALFLERWDAASGCLPNNAVTLDDVSRAIGRIGATLSQKNPANFMKDVVRRRDSYFRILPTSVREAGYGVAQRTGGSLCFTFEPIARCERMWVLPNPERLAQPHRVQSISIPIASRQLGREEETWMIQVVTLLKIIETHLALYSPMPVKHLEQLQISVKQRDAEIDALYLAQVGESIEVGDLRRVIVSCEVKGFDDDILKTQIAQQVKSLAANPVLRIEGLLPLAVKVIRARERCVVHVVEFQEVAPADADAQEFDTLAIATEQSYEVIPAVQGLTERISALSRSGLE